MSRLPRISSRISDLNLISVWLEHCLLRNTVPLHSRRWSGTPPACFQTEACLKHSQQHDVPDEARQKPSAHLGSGVAMRRECETWTPIGGVHQLLTNSKRKKKKRKRPLPPCHYSNISYLFMEIRSHFWMDRSFSVTRNLHTQPASCCKGQWARTVWIHESLKQKLTSSVSRFNLQAWGMGWKGDPGTQSRTGPQAWAGNSSKVSGGGVGGWMSFIYSLWILTFSKSQPRQYTIYFKKQPYI